MNQGRQNHSADELLDNLLSVEEVSQSLGETEFRIKNHSASADEVIHWYRTRDPIDETWQLDVSVISGSKDISNIAIADLALLEDSALHQHAALILIGSLISPNTIGSDDTDLNIGVGSITNPDISVLENIKALIPNLKANGIFHDQRDFARVSMAGDLLSEVARRVYVSGLLVEDPKLLSVFRQHDVPYVVNDRELSMEFIEQSTCLQALAFEKCLEMAEATSDSDLFEQSLQLLVRSRAEILNLHPNHDKALTDIMAPMLKYYMKVLSSDALDGVQWGKLKGTWHEVFWFIDFNMYRQLTGKDYGVSPSTSTEDCPHVGNPIKRKIDYRVGNNDFHKLVQLKSSRKAAKGSGIFHPDIEKVIEEDFSYDKVNLMWKLLNYIKYIESGFSEGMCAVALEFVLESVKDQFISLDSMSQEEPRMSAITSNFRNGEIVKPNIDSRARALFDEIANKAINPFTFES